MNHEARISSYDNPVRSKTSMLRSSLCDYSDAIYLLKEL